MCKQIKRRTFFNALLSSFDFLFLMLLGKKLLKQYPYLQYKQKPKVLPKSKCMGLQAPTCSCILQYLESLSVLPK